MAHLDATRKSPPAAIADPWRVKNVYVAPVALDCNSPAFGTSATSERRTSGATVYLHLRVSGSDIRPSSDLRSTINRKSEFPGTTSGREGSRNTWR